MKMEKEIDKLNAKVILGSDDKTTFVKQAENAMKNLYSQQSDLLKPKLSHGVMDTNVNTEKPSMDEVEVTTKRTKAALEKVIEARLSVVQLKTIPFQNLSIPQYIKYTPAEQSAACNSRANQRVIWVTGMPQDPLEPPKFKCKRVPKAYSSLAVSVLQRSPPRPVIVQDQHDWNIVPCISNWKNNNGCTIPLDKRLDAADGRGLLNVQVNDDFVKLSEALNVAEHKAREAVEARCKIQREVKMKEQEKKDKELWMLAQRARMAKVGVGTHIAATGANATVVADRGGAIAYKRKAVDDVGVSNEAVEEMQECMERDALCDVCHMERERKRKLAANIGKKRMITRNRVISEKVDLGMAAIGAEGGELTYDQRLFNQEKGIESGFATYDTYNVYIKGLFASQSRISRLYHPPKDYGAKEYGGTTIEDSQTLDKVVNVCRFGLRAQMGTTARATEWAELHDLFYNRPMEFEMMTLGRIHLGWPCFLER